VIFIDLLREFGEDDLLLIKASGIL